MEKNKKVIITDHLHPLLAERLRDAGFEVDIEPEISNAALQTVIGQYTGLVLSTKTLVTKELIDGAVALQFIARAGSGMENIDVKYAESKNIHVVNAPEGNANAVAEHALGMLLALLNNFIKADREMRSGIWQREPNRGTELDGKTVGIIGYGHTGKAFAKKLAGFDVNILVYDKYLSGFSSGRISETKLVILQQEADIISFHVPLTAETLHYFNNEFLNNCKNQIWLINTSRGKVVSTKHLLEALEIGKVRGAALDVFEEEKMQELSENYKNSLTKLYGMNNVVLTPHIAGWTVESYKKISSILADKVLALDLR